MIERLFYALFGSFTSRPLAKVSDATAFRAQLADYLLAQRTLRDPAVERAVRIVPRHLFAPSVPIERAYEDGVLRLKEVAGVLISSLSQPAMIVEMLQQLELFPGARVLEIGTGSGYTAALIAEIVGDHGMVTSIDIDAELITQAAQQLAQAGYPGVHVSARDGRLGYEERAPYDRILLTVCAAQIAPAWWEQLAEDGILVLPLSLGGMQKCVAFERTGDEMHSRSVIDCGFIMLRGEDAPERAVQIVAQPPVFCACAQGGAELQGLGEALLAGPTGRWDVPVRVKAREVDSALLWIALRNANFCRIESLGSTQLFPELHTEGPHIHAGAGLLNDRGVALFGIVPEPLIAGFGDAADLALRLCEELRGWDHAGRPGRSITLLARRGEVKPEIHYRMRR